jgi:(p)ppGpp synthase/HD superfamily hydrolase
MTELIRLCQTIANIAHRGQTRRDGITPYINHPTQVAARFPDDEDAQAVAWLHDVLEDGEITFQDLLGLSVPLRIAHAVRWLTRPCNGWQSYTSYICRLSQNELARKVKIADMKCNLAEDPTPKQREKYARGLEILEGVRA